MKYTQPYLFLIEYYRHSLEVFSASDMIFATWFPQPHKYEHEETIISYYLCSLQYLRDK